VSRRATVGVCHGPRCGDCGGRALAAELRERGVRVEVLDCQSLCPHAPVARLPDRALLRAGPEQVICAVAQTGSDQTLLA